jgi:hypothetical protein
MTFGPASGCYILNYYLLGLLGGIALDGLTPQLLFRLLSQWQQPHFLGGGGGGAGGHFKPSRFFLGAFVVISQPFEKSINFYPKQKRPFKY